MTPNKQVSEAVSATLTVVPFLADFLLAAPVEFVDDAQAGEDYVAATDGLRIYVWPQFCRMTLAERVFVLAHELLHNVGRHVHAIAEFERAGAVTVKGKRLPYNKDLLNIAADAWINGVLCQYRIGRMPSSGVPPAGDDFAKVTWLDIYERMIRNAKPDRFGSAPARGGRSGFDKLVEPPAEVSQTEHKGRMASALARGMPPGRGPGELFRTLFEAGLAVRTPWQAILRSSVLRTSGADRSDWENPDPEGLIRPYIDPSMRRLLYPSRRAACVGPVFVVIDTSGSIDSKQLTRFSREVLAIVAECSPSRLLIGCCDDRLQHVEAIDDPDEITVEGYLRKGTRGGGGTSFVPPFKWLIDTGETVDALVYLTDGYGDYPDRKLVDAAGVETVIWALVDSGARPPLGVTINLE